jgi:hypothetical protein
VFIMVVGVGLFGGCGRRWSALVCGDLFEHCDGLPDLVEVGGAAVAGAEVVGDAGPPVGREVAATPCREMFARIR